MKQPSREQAEQLAKAMRSFPLVKQWIEEWRQYELELLPNAFQNVGQAQGRCLALTEMVKTIERSIDTAAKQ